MTETDELRALIADLKDEITVLQEERTKTEAKNRELVNASKRGKKLGLVFERQDDDASKLMKDNIPLIVEDPARRIDPVITGENSSLVQHSLIKGDNLHALTALVPKYKREVDVIYIDPPYNTGNRDFVYNDKYVDENDAYRHSKWLSFMERRWGGK